MSRDLLTPLWTAKDLPALSPREWEMLLAQARVTRLSSRLASHLERMGWRPDVPAAAWLHLESARRYTDRLRHEVLWETDHIAAALRDVATPVVLLKGAAYVAADLPPGRGRLFSDIDILVDRDRLRDVETALFAAGWMPERLSPYDDRYYREWMHELPPLQHVVRGTYLDVHHTIAPPTSRYPVDGTLLLQRRESLPDAPGLSVLAPVDMVLHSALHLMQEGEFGAGLRDLLDLDDLLRHFGASRDFWPHLARRSRELSLDVPLGQVLRQLNALFGFRMPPEWSVEFASCVADGLRGRWLTAILAQGLRPNHVSCDTMPAAVSRWLLYVRAHWLRMPWYQIAPHLARKGFTRARERLLTERSPQVADA